MATHPTLDHIVLLVPSATLADPPPWLTAALTLLPGGAHAGGLTSNKLILFQDGTYIELIAFAAGLDPARRRTHRWGDRPEGRIIDWALTLHSASSPDDTESEAHFGAAVQEKVRRAGAGVVYEDPVGGGRTTPSGVVLQWATSSPIVDKGPSVDGGELPFWCLDRTPRRLRVPYQEEHGAVSHPCGAVGVARVTVLVRDREMLEMVKRVYDAILPRASGDEVVSEEREGRCWEVRVPNSRRGARAFLKVGLLEGDRGEDPGGDVSAHLKLSLFTSSGGSRKISGHFVDGWLVEIDLVSLPEQ